MLPMTSPSLFSQSSDMNLRPLTWSAPRLFRIWVSFSCMAACGEAEYSVQNRNLWCDSRCDEPQDKAAKQFMSGSTTRTINSLSAFGADLVSIAEGRMGLKAGGVVEDTPTKRFGVSYGGDIVGSFDTAKEALAARTRHAPAFGPFA
jgi:hypothetical protein